MTGQKKEKPEKEYRVTVTVDTTELDKLIDKLKEAKSLATETTSVPICVVIDMIVDAFRNAMSSRE